MHKMKNAQLHNVRTDAKTDVGFTKKKEGRSCLTKTNFAAHNRMCQNSAGAFFEKKTHKHTRIHAHNVPWQHKSSFCCCYFDCLANPPLVFKAFFSLTGAKPLNSTHQRDTCTCE